MGSKGVKPPFYQNRRVSLVFSRCHDVCACTSCTLDAQEKNSTTTASSSSALRVDEGCCLDFTHPCDVPPFPNTPNTEAGKRSLWPTWFKTDATRDKHDKEYKWTKEYGKGGLFWSYGGAGTFLSAGLLEKVQQGVPQEMKPEGQRGGGGGNSSSSGTAGGWERCTEMFGIGYDTDIQV